MSVAESFLAATLTPAEKAKAAAEPWTGHDTRLLLVTFGSIAIIVLLIAWAKMNPFLALILGSAFMSLASGVPVADAVDNFESGDFGVGSVLKEVGLLVALGAMLGKLLADSGGANQVVDKLIAHAKPKHVPWLMALVAVIIGIPMFFEIGLVLLLPVVVLVAVRSRIPLMLVAVPAWAGLSVLHGFVPPHPGPLAAIASLDPDGGGAILGPTIALGLLCAIPTVIICGPLFAKWCVKWVPVGGDHAPMAKLLGVGAGNGTGTGGTDSSGSRRPPADGGTDDDTAADWHGRQAADDPELKRRPSFGVTLATILFPVVLMLMRALADVIWANNPDLMIRRILDFLGEPLVAMVLAVLLAMVTFGYAVGFSGASISKRVGDSIGPVALAVFVIGAGGGFKGSLVGAGADITMAKAAINLGVPILLLGWLLAVLIRVATGSATVAITTAAGIITTLAAAADLSNTHMALLVLALGAGSLFLSHVNDAGFWLVKESFGLTMGQTFKTWSVMETMISVIGLGLTALLWVVL